MQLALPLTTSVAIIAALIILALTVRVIQLRRKNNAVMGDNGDRALAKAIRGHANAVEQLPIALILMGLSEAQGGITGLLVLAAGLLCLGRLLHAVYFAVHGTHWRFRWAGMWMTVAAQTMLIITAGLSLL